MTEAMGGASAQDALGGMLGGLAALARHLSAGRDAQALKPVAGLVAEALDAATVGLVVVDRDRGRLVSAHGLLAPAKGQRAFQGPQIGEALGNLLTVALTSGRPVVAQGAGDELRSAAERRWAMKHGIGASLAVPLQYGDEALGVLVLHRDKTQGPFTAQEIAAAEIAAHQISSALSRWGAAFGSMQPVQCVGLAVRRAGNAASALADCTGLVLELTGADALGLFVVLGQEKGRLRLLHAGGTSQSLLGALRQEKEFLPLLQRARAEGPGQVAHVGAQDADMRVLADAGARSVAWAPLMVGEREVGLLVAASEQPWHAGEHSLALLRDIALVLAVVMSWQSVLQEGHQRAARLSAVSAAAQAFNSTLDPEELVGIIWEQLRDQIPCAAMLLARYNPSDETYQVIGGRGDTECLLTSAGGPSSALPWAWITPLKAGEVLYLADTSGLNVREMDLLTQRGVRSLVSVPLRAQGSPVGCLTLCDRTPAAFSPECLALLKDLAPHLAAALVNAQLHTDLQTAYDQLREAQEQLLRSEQLRVVGSIAAGISHDFNNVLAVVLGQAQLGQLETQDDAILKRLREIEAAALQGAATVRRLAEFAGRPGGEVAIETSVAAIAQQALDITRPRWKDHAEARGVTIVPRLEIEDGLSVFAPPDAVRDVLVNLILNAAEAMHDGGELTLSARRAGDRALLSVKDTGTGMKEEIMQRALEPFFSTRGPKRLGLGLPVVLAITTRLGGKLNIESEPDKGTTITLDLPTTLRSAAPQTEVAAAPAGRVVVVEDNEVLLHLVCQILMGAGFEVEGFRSGPEALRSCRTRPPDVLVTDLGMAEMTGWDVAREVRQISATTAIVMLTGWAGTVSGEEAAARGLDFVMTKPVDSQTLISAVKCAMERHHEKRAQAARS